jgi:TolB protein
MRILLPIGLGLVLFLALGCPRTDQVDTRVVPHEERWGIYVLDLVTEDVELIASSESKYTGLRLNHAGDRFVFSQKIGGPSDEDEEICALNVDGTGFRQITDNPYWDLYPAWSPDDSRIAFLSLRENDLDLYVMDSSGGNVGKLYDSGSHDADVHWEGSVIVFTAFSRIWRIDDDGTDPVQLTDPPRAGEWGNANLPFGDYDPRLSLDGQRIVFERLEDDQSPHGNYNVHVMNVDGSSDTSITDNGFTQGMASWSHDGEKLVYVVTAIEDQGKYDIYMMNADGSDNRNVTPEYFPEDFLCHTPVFSPDDSKLYFVGEWWE